MCVLRLVCALCALYVRFAPSAQQPRDSHTSRVSTRFGNERVDGFFRRVNNCKQMTLMHASVTPVSMGGHHTASDRH